jgi:plasmid stability protein
MQCMYGACMSRTVQIRDLPDDVHRVIRVRAAAVGLSLAEYLRQEITRLAQRPTLPEWTEQAAALAQLTPAVSTQEIVDAVRAGRGAR